VLGEFYFWCVVFCILYSVLRLIILISECIVKKGVFFEKLFEM